MTSEKYAGAAPASRASELAGGTVPWPAQGPKRSAQTMRGTVVELASAADPRSGMFNIEVQFDTPPPRLVSGLVARLQLTPTSETQPLTYVPMSALVEGSGDRASVFVLDDGKAVQRDVRVAFITKDSIALESGLAAGETVITDGALFLENGEAVEVVPESETKQAVNTPPVPREG